MDIPSFYLILIIFDDKALVCVYINRLQVGIYLSSLFFFEIPTDNTTHR